MTVMDVKRPVSGLVQLFLCVGAELGIGFETGSPVLILSCCLECSHHDMSVLNPDLLLTHILNLFGTFPGGVLCTLFFSLML